MTDPTIFDLGFDVNLNKISNDVGNNPTIFNSPETGINAGVLSGGLVSSKSTGGTNNPGIQLGLIQTSNGSNLAPFDVANDGTGNIRRVGAIKLASAQDLGITTLTPAPTANKVIYSDNTNDLIINAPTTSGNVWITQNGNTLWGGGTISETYANPLSLPTGTGTTRPHVRLITTTNAIGDATINASDSGRKGQILYLIITNDATANRTITFGTNFKSSSTLVGTTSKSATITFISDGTNFYEVARTLNL